MTLTLPAAAACRLRGHAWTERGIYIDDGEVRDIRVCPRCGATTELAGHPTVYKPRHLRQRA